MYEERRESRNETLVGWMHMLILCHHLELEMKKQQKTSNSKDGGRTVFVFLAETSFFIHYVSMRTTEAYAFYLLIVERNFHLRKQVAKA